MKPDAAIIGLDGVPVKLLKELADNDTMPHMKELLKQGSLTKMRSSLPPNSASSWNSMITGTNPGTHGVYGFTDFIPGTYTMSFHNSHKLKAKPFWKTTKKKTLGINLPATYPAQPINGTIITGFVSPQIEKAVYPPEHLPWLNENNYQIDVDTSIYNESIPLFLGKLEETLDKRLHALDHLMKQQYDLIFFVVTGTDRIEHYLWHAYNDPNHIHHQGFLDFFTKVDQAIAHITTKLDPNASLMMLSDHGMGPIDKTLNLNTLLRQEGYLYTGNTPRKSFNNIKEATTAFASESTKIYLNHKGRFPKGSVNSKDIAPLQEELVDLLTGLRYKGRIVVKKVHLKQDTFTGPETSNGPDLVVIPMRGFSLKTGLFKDTLYEDDFLSGTHTEDNAFLYLRGWSHEIVDPSIEDTLHIFKQVGEKKNATQ